MLKAASSCLLFTVLLFSSAHAPTSQQSRNLPEAALDSMADALTTDRFEAHAGTFIHSHSALTREYDEHNDLERFELDELFLPKLDVTLPELFDWSDGDRTYLAISAIPLAFGFALAAADDLQTQASQLSKNDSYPSIDSLLIRAISDPVRDEPIGDHTSLCSSLLGLHSDCLC
jgi:hypothetical protein